ncbi:MULTISPECIES: PTS sugar transporter subunit IIA [Tatumella]|uniref:PTS sugar transporter subunit IIA n=1 Tax=Tatumella punctata TaxID=399969 RepID=A0ABW1VLP9_9GAMM|nr:MULTISPECIES: PTS sugar transporter subunit IIA [unclassified Tatumella]MBS0856870.1 PTS sugar transporter subunit IIA [Tatumella sp. JGM16]MBS0877701.1 PTS sugar transporter subunit IIA [Tatumella sp. JGM82]MBS0891406.1 PTS sugar transporter subunit IIA [Tatumella sp. JGM94]MBS0892422.1 PTS sugar transporter subunit IIA [Tatumella sp. JGM130]MBS0902234.1 PTS sugar transporter subunit IIA [Tatumella sp. JGM100]
MLTDYLTKERIHICDTVADWQQAVTLSADPLLKQGVISQRYIDEIIAEHGRTGPYYVLAPGVAMPHSRPENGSNGIGLSLLVIRQGINFGSEDNDPVKVIFFLAAKDADSHIALISSLAELLDDEENIALLATGNRDTIDTIIQRY